MSQGGIGDRPAVIEAFSHRDVDAFVALVGPDVESGGLNGGLRVLVGTCPNLYGAKRSSENGSTGRPGGLLTRAAVQGA